MLPVYLLFFLNFSLLKVKVMHGGAPNQSAAANGISYCRKEDAWMKIAQSSNEKDVLSRSSALTHVLPAGENFPSWVSIADRKLVEVSPIQIKPHIVVAKDGSGNFHTVQEAITAAPDNSTDRFVIYVKKGIYEEKVEVGKKKNIAIFGDGMDFTIISWNVSVANNVETFNTATLGVLGDSFMAQDIWVRNTAGPENHQAVALLVGGDMSVINRCRIDGYQDTLCTQAGRQFYRDSEISGTIDFIFGNAAVVLQNCTIIAKKPLSNQKNVITAQGRDDLHLNSGTSIQKCRIIPSSDLSEVKGRIPTYLGRPWRNFSRTVIMESYIGDHIAPEGWLEWNGSFALDTLYYGEYMNYGPGANTSRRVKWPGYRVITNPDEALNFTVGHLIKGGEWLNSSEVNYTIGL